MAEIISSLSILESAALNTLATIVAKKIIGEEFEEDKIKSITTTVKDDGKSIVSCIHYLLVSATQHNVHISVFNEELQQLGLPKHHAEQMCEVLSEFSVKIREKLQSMSLKSNFAFNLKCFIHIQPSYFSK